MVVKCCLFLCGGLMTEQVTLPDFYHNTHAIYMMMVDYAPVYPDFQLEERYGVRHIFPELQCAMPLADEICSPASANGVPIK